MDTSISLLLVQINSAKPQDVLGKDSKSGNEKLNNKMLRSDRINLFLSLLFHTVEKYIRGDEMF